MELHEIPVYVDPLRDCLTSPKWHWPQSAHLFVLPGDDPVFSLRALHDTADTLGLKRALFQVDAKLPHYDLAPTVHSRAIRGGFARPCNSQATVDAMNAWRTAVAAGRVDLELISNSTKIHKL